MDSFSQNDELEARILGAKSTPCVCLHPDDWFWRAKIQSPFTLRRKLFGWISFRIQTDRWEFPAGYSDIIELSEEKFRKYACLDDPDQMPKRNQPMAMGDLLVSFLNLHMAGGKPLFLMVEAPAKLPIENHSFMQFLLSKGSFHMRLCGGGMGVVNLGNLLGFNRLSRRSTDSC
ncbi:MAG: hypothetical protein WDM76_13190 [Limisphaerales bacterium]